MKGRDTLLSLLMIVLCIITPRSFAASGDYWHGERVNVVIFLVDDLGFGDVQFLASNHSFLPLAKTENINKLAASGATFTSAYAAESVCTPSRAALLTGRYAFRSGMSSSHENFRMFISPASSSGLPHSEYTLAEALKAEGYDTKLVGKWHLGIGEDNKYLPMYHGFDSFFGLPVTNTQSCKLGNRIMVENEVLFLVYRVWQVWLSILVVIISLIIFSLISVRVGGVLMVGEGVIIIMSSYYVSNYTLMSPMSCILMNDTTVIDQPFNLSSLSSSLTSQAIDFITAHARCPYPHHTNTHPHPLYSGGGGEGEGGEGGEGGGAPFLLVMSYHSVHTALGTSSQFKGKSSCGEYCDQIEELDASIGQVISSLSQSHLLNNTLLIFTSDHGPFLEELHEGGNSGYGYGEKGEQRYLKGGKGQAWEGGVKVPTFISWLGMISPNTSISSPISLMDIYPTVLDLANHPPPPIIIDGINLLPLLIPNYLNTPPIIINNSSNNNDDESDQEISSSPSSPLSSSSPFDIFDNRRLYHMCGDIIHAMRIGELKMHFHAAVWDYPPPPNLLPAMNISSFTYSSSSPPIILNEDVKYIAYHHSAFNPETKLMIPIADLKSTSSYRFPPEEKITYVLDNIVGDGDDGGDGDDDDRKSKLQNYNIFQVNRGQHCKSRVICECIPDGRRVITFDSPLLFNLTADPSEVMMIDPTTRFYSDTLLRFMNEKQKFENEIVNASHSVPNQLNYALPIPWLFPSRSRNN